MRFKWAKLLMNLANALEAACGQIDQRTGLAAAARAEGREVMEAAGIDRARSAEETARRGDLVKILPIDGATRSGGSTWQSIARGPAIGRPSCREKSVSVRVDTGGRRINTQNKKYKDQRKQKQ